MKIAVLVAAFLFFLAAACGAEETGPQDYVFLDGIISDFKGPGFILNERHTIIVTHKTGFYDSSGSKIASYRLEPQKWVYVEGYPGANGSVEAEKIYVLPGPARKKGSHKYDFMQSP
ncbi:MAG: hypothetical protein H3C68_02885 [Deltaproteobacteria bacterium]|nr:hypothetical protein [Deltaproteobacteria bacterium]MBZ0221235.1 DUF5666 domain-containing protein [Deltaproteobacteria bacterium]